MERIVDEPWTEKLKNTVEGGNPCQHYVHFDYTHQRFARKDLGYAILEVKESE